MSRNFGLHRPRDAFEGLSAWAYISIMVLFVPVIIIGLRILFGG